jgi:desulfoferrodoxin (superoxide reductase-like protein)
MWGSFFFDFELRWLTLRKEKIHQTSFRSKILTSKRKPRVSLFFSNKKSEKLLVLSTAGVHINASYTSE